MLRFPWAEDDRSRDQGYAAVEINKLRTLQNGLRSLAGCEPWLKSKGQFLGPRTRPGDAWYRDERR